MNVRSIGVVVFLLMWVQSLVTAQQPQHQHPPGHKVSPPTPDQQPAAPMTMPMDMTGPIGITLARDGSGTSWLPDLTLMFAVHGNAGAWRWMVHQNLFVQYISEAGD